MDVKQLGRHHQIRVLGNVAYTLLLHTEYDTPRTQPCPSQPTSWVSWIRNKSALDQDPTGSLLEQRLSSEVHEIERVSMLQGARVTCCEHMSIGTLTTNNRSSTHIASQIFLLAKDSVVTSTLTGSGARPRNLQDFSEVTRLNTCYCDQVHLGSYQQ